MLPVVVEMRYEPGNEHQVERPLAGHLIRDVDLTAPRVADHRFHAADSCLLSPGLAAARRRSVSRPRPGPGLRLLVSPDLTTDVITRADLSRRESTSGEITRRSIS